MTTVELALYNLRQAFEKDHDYAWSWHCNIACCAMDEGILHPEANRIASRVMKIVFDVDTSSMVSRYFDNDVATAILNDPRVIEYVEAKGGS